MFIVDVVITAEQKIYLINYIALAMLLVTSTHYRRGDNKYIFFYLPLPVASGCVCIFMFLYIFMETVIAFSRHLLPSTVHNL